MAVLQAFVLPADHSESDRVSKGVGSRRRSDPEPGGREASFIVVTLCPSRLPSGRKPWGHREPPLSVGEGRIAMCTVSNSRLLVEFGAPRGPPLGDGHHRSQRPRGARSFTAVPGIVRVTRTYGFSSGIGERTASWSACRGTHERGMRFHERSWGRRNAGHVRASPANSSRTACSITPAVGSGSSIASTSCFELRNDAPNGRIASNSPRLSFVASHLMSV